MSKRRLDVLLVEGGYFPSRERAKRSIMAGEVFVNGMREDKAGTLFHPDKIRQIEVKGDKMPFVSRGGLKLQKALQVFSINVRECVCLDIGASTGGFTDCMLQSGAKLVYAVDVGYGQLAYRLMRDERVISLERTNFRHLSVEVIPEPVDFASADVSFISLRKILPVVPQFLKPEAEMVCLVKPQFEAGRDKVGKKGVVRDAAVHREVITDVCHASVETGFTPVGVSFSPITGPEGNIEYLLHLRFTQVQAQEWKIDDEEEIGRTVEEAHMHFM